MNNVGRGESQDLECICSEFLVEWVKCKAVVLVVYVEYGITIIKKLVIVEINFVRYGLKMLLI